MKNLCQLVKVAKHLPYYVPGITSLHLADDPFFAFFIANIGSPSRQRDTDSLAYSVNVRLAWQCSFDSRAQS